ncbi:hypothetical protein AMTR_s00488p00012060 [Amborella trichopoda]|uniref:Uncharacterized protein n=1 Tax=Amborella trichopoda TaxID=13333 RepID=W1NTV4_AMBTC|nr:hypothetical protein AMTR_s00488p00012060 [Amborella trichopoda]
MATRFRFIHNSESVDSWSSASDCTTVNQPTTRSDSTTVNRVTLHTLPTTESNSCHTLPTTGPNSITMNRVAHNWVGFYYSESSIPYPPHVAHYYLTYQVWSVLSRGIVEGN